MDGGEESESYSVKVHTIADTGLSILQRKSTEITYRVHVFLSPGLFSVCEKCHVDARDQRKMARLL